jgi:16S rRNA (uracil1498-N3)-methyltransferase
LKTVIFLSVQLPYFYIDNFDTSQKDIVLNEETSKYAVQVLRMKKGERLHLTDGKGALITAEISEDNRKHCSVRVKECCFLENENPKVSIAISLLKNSNRFEWFLEKATEIGIDFIIPLLCERTEKEKFKIGRLRQILISAMLQSRQVWLPELCALVSFNDFLNQNIFKTAAKKYIAHCADCEKNKLIPSQNESSLILIGPEGDFSDDEIQMALNAGCLPATLGNTRLRTETAGMVAAVLLKNSS